MVSVIGNPLDPLVLKPDVTYAIAGGLGGIGQSVVDQMFDCGARHFAFFSRSGDARPEARKYLDNLERRGGHARAFKADISKYESLSAAIEQMNREMPPVKGFINSAMDLQVFRVTTLLSNKTYADIYRRTVFYRRCRMKSGSRAWLQKSTARGTSINSSQTAWTSL